QNADRRDRRNQHVKEDGEAIHAHHAEPPWVGEAGVAGAPCDLAEGGCNCSDGSAKGNQSQTLAAGSRLQQRISHHYDDAKYSEHQLRQDANVVDCLDRIHLFLPTRGGSVLQNWNQFLLVWFIWI